MKLELKFHLQDAKNRLNSKCVTEKLCWLSIITIKFSKDNYKGILMNSWMSVTMLFWGNLEIMDRGKKMCVVTVGWGKGFSNSVAGVSHPLCPQDLRSQPISLSWGVEVSLNANFTSV